MVYFATLFEYPSNALLGLKRFCFGNNIEYDKKQQIYFQPINLIYSEFIPNIHLNFTLLY